MVERFIDAQRIFFEQALFEIKSGKKRGHWIWFIFPQLKGLGRSSNSQYYGITNLEEATEYLNTPILNQRLREITEALLRIEGKTAIEILGHIDARKVKSCMTLFNEVAPNDIFADVVKKYYHGRWDKRTLSLLQGKETKEVLGRITKTKYDDENGDLNISSLKMS